jgi:hypothetical protein
VKASIFMFFNYLATIGVPVLMLLLVVNAAVFHQGTLQTVLLALIGAGCLVYGAVGIREVFSHGGSRRERAGR